MRLLVLLLLLPITASANPTPEVRRQLGQAGEAVTEKRFEDAIGLYDVVLQNAPDVLERTWGLGMAHYSLGDFTRAREHFDRMLKQAPNSPRALYGRGLVALREGRLDAAIADFQAALRVNPDDVRARYRLGQALHEKGKLGEAELELKGVLERRFVHQAARMALAYVLRDAGRADDARAELARFRRVASLLEPIRSAERRVRRTPNDVGALLRVGDLYRRAGNLRGARSAYERVLTLAPGDARATESLASLATTP